MENTSRKSLLFIRLIFLFIAIIALLLGILHFHSISNSPNDQCTWVNTEHGVKVVSVAANGVAEQAGMKTGDLILQIAGEYVVESSDAQRILEKQIIGLETSYLVHRNGEFVSLSLQIIKRGFTTLYLLFSIIGSVFLLVGAGIAWMCPRDLKARVLFFLFLSFMIFWFLTILPSQYSGYYRTAVILLFTSFTTIPAFFLYFFLIFPSPHPVLRKKPWAQITVFSPTLFILGLTGWGLLFGYKGTANIPLPLGAGLWGLYFLMGISRLLIYQKSEKDMHLKQQMRVLFWGLLIGIFPPLLSFIFRFLQIDVSIGDYTYPLMVAIPITFAYAVVRHRLMDIEFIIKKSFVYTLLTGLVIGFYFVIVQIFGKMIQDLSGITGSLVLILSTLFVAFLFAPAREKLQTLVDRAFFRQSYDYRETLRQFARRLNTLMEPCILMSTVLSNICETMHIRQGVFFVREKTLQKFVPQMGYPSLPEFNETALTGDNELCTRLIQEKKPVLFAALSVNSGEIKDLNKKYGYVVGIPLFYQNEMTGFILFGEKRSEIPYTTEDLELLDTISDQIAVALENGWMHEALSEQDRLKHELEIARRIQLNSLPQSHPKIPGYDIFGTSIPAKEVGGDYYDYLSMTKNRLGVVVGDVSGKGTSAALYQSKIQGFIRALIPSYDSPKDLLSQVNRLTFESVEEKSFITLVMAAIDPEKSEITLVRAGHPGVFHYRKSKDELTERMPQGIGVGMEKGDMFEKVLTEECIPLSSGDVFLFYSDGLLEAENENGEEYGEERLKIAFLDLVESDAESIVHGILSDIQKFVDKVSQKDDMTLVVVKVGENQIRGKPELRR